MRRFLLAVVCGAALTAATAIPALADAGPPGTTFPEQPGGHIQTGCAAVIASPGGGLGGAAEQHESATAATITTGLLTDACFGG